MSKRNNNAEKHLHDIVKGLSVIIVKLQQNNCRAFAQIHWQLLNKLLLDLFLHIVQPYNFFITNEASHQ